MDFSRKLDEALNPTRYNIKTVERYQNEDPIPNIDGNMRGIYENVFLKPDALWSYTAKNGIKVIANPEGWNHSYHAAEYDPSHAYVEVNIRELMYTTTRWSIEKAISLADEAILEYMSIFGADIAYEKMKLRNLVRPGD